MNATNPSAIFTVPTQKNVQLGTVVLEEQQ